MRDQRPDPVYRAKMWVVAVLVAIIGVMILIGHVKGAWAGVGGPWV